MTTNNRDETSVRLIRGRLLEVHSELAELERRDPRARSARQRVSEALASLRRNFPEEIWP